MSTEIAISRQVACAKRMLERNQRKFERLKSQNADINPHAWANEIESMEAIVATLERCEMLKEVGDEMISKA